MVSRRSGGMTGGNEETRVASAHRGFTEGQRTFLRDISLRWGHLAMPRALHL